MNEQNQNLINNAKTFENIFNVSEVKIKITSKHRAIARKIDKHYEKTNNFTLEESQALYDIVLELWYTQYSNAVRSFKSDYFFHTILEKYSKMIADLWQKCGEIRNLEDPQARRDEWLNICKKSISDLVIIRKDENSHSAEIRKKPNLRKLTPDTIFAILAATALFLGIALAILIR